MAELPLLQIVIASTRPGRAGPSIAAWFTEIARAHGGFEVEVVDLKEVDLPLFDEPNHPMRHEYVHDHTKAWSEVVARADAFVIVMPEYNHSFTAAIKNAIDYLHHEWAYKPVAFVSYGGVAAGTRAVQALKPTVSALKMMPIGESINIPFFQTHLDDDGVFTGAEGLSSASDLMLDALAGWTAAMITFRSPA